MKQFKLLPVKALMIFCPFFVLACDDEEGIIEEPLTATDFLTGGSQKSWYLSVQTPEEEISSCKASSPQSLDNTYVFYADGRFVFDHGEIIEDPECTDAGCCSDLINIEGTWKFIDNEERIEVFAKHKKDEPTYVLNEVLFNAAIDVLEKDKLVLKDGEFSLEFRPRQ